MNYIDSYNEIKKLQPPGIRHYLRNIALSGLSVVDRMKRLERFRKNRVQFLYIHHVFRDEEERFKGLMQRLSQDHFFIPYSEAVERLLTGNIDKPYISISSDDGFRNNLRAARVLSEFGAKGCFFINPGLIGVKEHSVIRRHCRERLNLPPIEMLDWKEVENLQRDGHEIGSHTMFHMNVAKAMGNEFVDDCGETLRIIQQRCGSPVHFAFPYGRFFHFNEEARKVVFESGFKSCASAERGCHITNTEVLKYDELCIRRDHVVLGWNPEQTLYFLSKNSERVSAANNLFPYTRV